MYTIVMGRSNPKRGDTLGYLLYVDDLPYVVVLSFDEAKRRAEPHIVKSLPVQIETYGQPPTKQWVYDYGKCDWKKK